MKPKICRPGPTGLWAGSLLDSMSYEVNYVITVATLSILRPILSAFMSLSSFSHIKVNVIGIIIRIQVDVNL